MNESSAIEHLRSLAVYFEGDIKENYGAAMLTISNDKADGYISSYDILPGLSCRVYNITYKEEFKIDLKLSDKRLVYFCFNVKGHLFHRFSKEEDFTKIEQNQNLIIISHPGFTAETVFAKDEKLEMCFVLIDKTKLSATDTNRGEVRQLEHLLSEILDKETTDKPYRYLGDIDTLTAQYAEILTENTNTDAVGRLITEGAVLNMLASQIEAHDNDSVNDVFDIKLSKSELSKITKIGTFVSEHIARKIPVEELSREYGLSPKKLQAGTRFLYGESVGKFILNVRLEYAKDLIQASDLSISEICYRIGLTSRSYFSKIFLERYGVKPSDYKKSFEKKNVLFELSYRSVANQEIDSKDIQQIVKIAREYNQSCDITGCLVYHEDSFFQILEGAKMDILDLYERIERDSRHKDIQLLWKGAIPKRNFTEWNMAFVADNRKINLPTQGNPTHLNFEKVLDQLPDTSIASDVFWKRVRTIIKHDGEH
ncbi:hypothetical protein GCM10009117_21980 [Gangjinia marincola]|uniref:Uncharacterized protein n=1 Tax=Gangjinia marincola TaxID=578463 RepID=A0ABP3XYH4_9FLAO